MKMKLGMVLVTSLVILIICESSLLALSSPVERIELAARSNNIVYGEIVEVVCTGEFEKSKCVDRTGYLASLKVKRTVKGTRYRRLYIRFMKSRFKEGCLGSPDEVHIVGELGLYYLQCRGDQCRLTHWNGVEYENRGYKPLPTCKE